MSGHLHPDRLLPSDPVALRVARALHDAVADLPIVSPHGHTDPAWFATNARFANATALLLTPDHYVLRMLRSQGIGYDALGVPRCDGGPVADPRAAWRLFASRYDLLHGTPSRLWIDHCLMWAFGIDTPPCAENADVLYDRINERLQDDDLRPLAVLNRARVESIATTEMALDDLSHHAAMEKQGLIGRIRTTYRPDDVTDPDNPAFRYNLERLGELTGQDVSDWDGMIAAHRTRRALFRRFGATATDHGMPDAQTADLSAPAKQALLTRLLSGPACPKDASLFRAQMLTEMAALSCEDGMVMQLHAGVRRNTDPALLASHGPNLGADIPARIDPGAGLAPLLARHGTDAHLRLVLFCLDESTYARDLAPMAGYWPALRLGPPWWFHDSPRGIRRYLDQVVETAGFANLAGFNDDTRALLSIPARHDVWRRCVAAFLAGMVADRTLPMPEAERIATWLCHGAARAAYANTRAAEPGGGSQTSTKLVSSSAI
ncbi:MAG: glucuronate isomerase [Roseivivax sp.]|nr:glucuronate isomerase [Roseivivax sp.]